MGKNRLTQLLDDRGLTRYELAKITGISRRIIYRLAATDKIPPHTHWETLKKIRDALELNCVDELEGK